MPTVPRYHGPAIPRGSGPTAPARHIPLGLRVPLSQVGGAHQARARALERMASMTRRQAAQGARASRITGREMVRREKAAARDFRFITSTIDRLTGFASHLARAATVGQLADASSRYKTGLDDTERRERQRPLTAPESEEQWYRPLVRERLERRSSLGRDLDGTVLALFDGLAQRMDRVTDSRLRADHDRKTVNLAGRLVDRASERLRLAALAPDQTVDHLSEHTALHDSVMDAAVAGGLLDPVEGGRRKFAFLSGLLEEMLTREIRSSAPSSGGGSSRAGEILARLERGDYLSRLASPQTVERLVSLARTQVRTETNRANMAGEAAAATRAEAPVRLAGDMDRDIDLRLTTGRGALRDPAAVLAAQGRDDAAAGHRFRARAAEAVHDWLAARRTSPPAATQTQVTGLASMLKSSPRPEDQQTGRLLDRAWQLQRHQQEEDPALVLAPAVRARLETMTAAGEVDPEDPRTMAQGLVRAVDSAARRMGLTRGRILTRDQARQLQDGYLSGDPGQRARLISEMTAFGRHTPRVLAEAGFEDGVVVAGQLLAAPETRSLGRLALAGHLAGGDKDAPDDAGDLAEARWAASSLGRAVATAARLQPGDAAVARTARALATTVRNLASQYRRLGLGREASGERAARALEEGRRAVVEPGRRYLVLPRDVPPDRAVDGLEHSLAGLPAFTALARSEFIDRAVDQGLDPISAARDYDTQLTRLARTGVWINAPGPGLPGTRVMLVNPLQGGPVVDHAGRPFTVSLDRALAAAWPDSHRPVQAQTTTADNGTGRKK